jgi:hypothetical protein
MKRNIYISIILLLFNIGSVTGQNKTIKENHPLMKVTDWNKRCVVFNPDCWAMEEQAILKQITSEEYDRMLKFGIMPAWPKQVWISPYISKDTIRARECYEKLNRLKMYKIATFEHFTKDGRSWGNMVILKIPYQENQDWDQEAKWDIIYFIFPESAVSDYSN